MKYIYGLYNQNSPNKLRYIGQTDNPKRRLRDHWSCHNRPPRDDREWERRINEWLRSLSAPPSMRILLMVDPTEADRAEHDAIIEARRLYGTGQLLNDNEGVDNRNWFHNLINGIDLRVSAYLEEPDAENITRIHPRPAAGTWEERRKPDIHIREWARAQPEWRHRVGQRGRIPADVRAAYRQAHPEKESG